MIKITDLFSFLPYGALTAVPLQIKLGSRTGWYEDTADIQTVSNSEYIGEIVSQITYSKRAVSFQIPVHSDSLQTAVRNICSLFRPSKQPGKLIYNDERYLSCYPSGTPTVQDVSDTFAWVTISLTAANPFWYDAGTPTTYNSGDTITNSGDFDAEVSMTASANTITLKVDGTTISTISARSGQTLTGCTIEITDNTISIRNGSTNVLQRADINSTYALVPPGQSVIAGANNITIRQRWFGV